MINTRSRVDQRRWVVLARCVLVWVWLAAWAIEIYGFPPQAVDERLGEGKHWTLIHTNCSLRNNSAEHRLTTEQFRSAPLSEAFGFHVLSGDTLLVGHAVDPAYVISELDPQLWLRASRPGIQMSVRVVLPHSLSPETGGTLTTLIDGPVYRDVSRWRRLSFAAADLDIARQLEEKLPYLRTKYGRGVTTRDAYVDQIVLDLVPGTGPIQVWVDDVEIAGAVPVNKNRIQPMVDPSVNPAGFETELATPRQPDVRIDGSVLEVAGRPFAARVIEYNGEPFEFLQQLGFNTLKLDRPPTSDQNLNARQLGLWLIAPPPDQVGLTALPGEYDRVLAWWLGDNLTSADLVRTKALVREIRFSDPWKERPLTASVSADWKEFARIADILVDGFEPIGGSFILSGYSDWLRQRADFAGRTMPHWSVMQTELPAEYIQQAAAIAGRVPPLPIEPCQLQCLMYETIAGGSRGHCFRSRNRLDGTDPQSRLRASTIRWINAQLDQMLPWIAGGAVQRRLDSWQDDVQVTTLKTSRSRLLLVQRPTHLEQWVAGTPPVKTLVINNPSSAAADQVYRISEHALQPLDRGRQLNSTQIKIDHCPANVAIVMTQEPLIIRSVSESITRFGAESQIQLHAELSQQWLALSQIVLDQMQRIGQGSATASGATNEATNYMQQVSLLVANGSASSAVPYLIRADQRLAQARQTMIMQAKQSFSNASASPLFAHVALLPLHWQLAAALPPLDDWQPNGLPGGEFEDLQQLTGSGWQNHRSFDSSLETLVELSPQAAVRGTNGLVFSAAGSGQAMQSPPLWIKTARVPIQAGQLVRIHGWVNIPQPITGSLDGLMIFDTIGGRHLSERISVTRGWQEFTIYRAATEDTNLQITFALTGSGRVMLDEVTVRTTTPQFNEARQARQESPHAPD